MRTGQVIDARRWAKWKVNLKSVARLSVYYDNVYYKIALISFTHKSTEFLPTLLKIDECIIGPVANATFFLLPPEDAP